MIPDLGLIALVLAALAAIYGFVMAILGGTQKRPAYIESARRAAVVVMPLLTLACLAIIYSNLTGNYSLEYTYRVSNNTTPAFLRITALWGGQNGSILFWNWLMSLYIFFVFLRPWKGNRDLLPWVITVSIGTQAFFILLTIFFANPFARLYADAVGNVSAAVFQPAGLTAFTPPDGQGLNPLLRHPGMIIHPPMLYLGFVGLVIPFAYAMGALLAKNKTDSWIRAMRRPTLVAWLFLSMGLLLGARWAYDVLGWGGYWGWDPVENSALLPWLTATAFLHSVVIQEKRGMFKIWNMILIVLSFCLMILGTFVTRTGVISSVHSFARSSLGIPFLGFTAAVLVGSFALIALRSDLLKSENKLESLLSREAMFLLNNFLFMTLTFTVFVGTYYSMFSEIFVNEKLTVGPPVFNQLIGPQVAALVLLMGIGPLAAWHKSSSEALGRMIWKPAVLAAAVMVLLFVSGVNLVFVVIGFGLVTFSLAITLTEYWRGMRARHRQSGENYFNALTHLIERNRRRYGGYMIHLGVLVMGIGVIGSLNYQVQTQRSLAPGGQMQVGSYTITYERALTCDPSTGQMSSDCTPWYTERGQDIAIVAGYMTIQKAGQAPVRVAPYREIFLNGTGELTPPGVLSTVSEDLYLLFLGEQSGFGTIKAYINPLIQFLWVGGIILVIGTLVAMWPTPAVRRQTVTAPERAVAGAAQ